MSATEQDLERLVAAVRETPKWRHVAADLMRRCAARELAKGRPWKEALKATKRKLHQVAGAYLDSGAHYGRWLDELRAAHAQGPAALRAACQRVMQHHASTRERLPLLDEFYTTALAGLPPVRSVLDVGCGLHPLALPWMGLPAECSYTAVDIYEDMAAFLGGFLALLPVRGRAEAGDALQSLPEGPFDLAYLLKTIPCLEQEEKEVGRRLLEEVPAAVLLVSFPAQGLSGRRGKGMEVNYEARMGELLRGTGWDVERFEFASELLFRVKK
jgi:16S rRNA (guanine(1405)-N(7))-methyltransferase